MSSNICFEKDSNQKENVNKSDVCCDIQGKRQTFRNSRISKGHEEQHHTKYISGKDEQDECCSLRCVDEPPTCGPPRNCNSKPPIVASARGICPIPPVPEPPKRCCEKAKKGNVCDPKTQIDDHDYADQLCHIPNGTKLLPAHCIELPIPRKVQPCTEKTKWQTAKYCRDDCGSGIVPRRYTYQVSRRIWCRTPLTTYQASHGELGRQILCREKCLKRSIGEGPPCNVCEYILPPCRGYYRQYDCVKPCEDEAEMYVYRNGRNRLRDRVERYWDTCYNSNGKEKVDVNKYAPQNMALALRFRRKAFGAPCW